LSQPQLSLVVARPLPSRPATATAAAVVMLATGILGLTVALITVLGMHSFNDSFRRDVSTFGPPPSLVDTTELTGRVVFEIVSVGALVCALVTAVLACGVLRANRGARVGAWLISAVGTIGALVTIAGAVLVRVSVDVRDFDAQTSITVATIRAAQDAVPSWCSGLVGSLSGAVAFGYIAVAVLLAVPASKAYFRRVIEPWPESEAKSATVDP
jgi:hypothetical protein